MKNYIKHLLIVIAAMVYSSIVMARGEEAILWQEPVPTIKVAVCFTKSAADVFDDAGLDMFAYLELRESEIRQLLNFDGGSADFNIEFSAKTLLSYKEPQYRGQPNPYFTTAHEGMDQVFEELANHDAYLDFLNNPANDSNGDGIWDEASATTHYFANKANLDMHYIQMIRQLNPDVVLIIADEQGEPVVADEAIWELTSGAQHDAPLYAVVNARYFADNAQALPFAFFSLFCRSEYSDADINDDYEPTNPGGATRSLMSYEWTSYEGDNRLTANNKKVFRHNMGKLKLDSRTSQTVLSGETVDVSYVQEQVDNLAAIVMVPGTSGTPTIIAPRSSAPAYGDATGQDVPLVESFATYTVDRYPVVSATAPDVSIPAGTSSPDLATQPLPIDFDNDISSSTFLDYVTGDFGAEATFATTGGNSSTRGMKVVKQQGQYGKWAIATLTDIRGVTFTSTDQKLSVDIKSPDASTDVTLILEDADGNKVSKKYTANDLVAGGWKTLVFDFGNATNRTGTITNGANYGTISLQFNSGVSESGNKTYYVDNIKKAATAGADLLVYMYDYSASTQKLPMYIRNNGSQKVNDIKGILYYGSNWEYFGNNNSDLDPPGSPSLTDIVYTWYRVSNIGGNSLQFTLNNLDHEQVANNDRYKSMSWDLSFRKRDPNNTDPQANTFRLVADGIEPLTSLGTISGSAYNDPSLSNNTFIRTVGGVEPEKCAYLYVDPNFAVPFPVTAGQPLSLSFQIGNDNFLATCTGENVSFYIEVDPVYFSNPLLGGVGPYKIEGNMNWYNLPNISKGSSINRTLTMTYLGGNTTQYYDFGVYSANNFNSEVRQYHVLSSGRVGDVIEGEDSKVAVYPNPFTHDFTIDFESRAGQEQVSLQVFDLAGRVVLSKDIATESGQEAQSIKIDGSALPNGAYTYILDIGDSELIRGKLLKK